MPPPHICRTRSTASWPSWFRILAGAAAAWHVPCSSGCIRSLFAPAAGRGLLHFGSHNRGCWMLLDGTLGGARMRFVQANYRSPGRGAVAFMRDKGLGGEDSNLQPSDPKSAALPLRHRPSLHLL